MMSIIIHTANILGIFTDPFEFEGDYGQEVNPIRQKVFEMVMTREDREYGPTLGQLITPGLMEEIKKKQSDLGVSDADFAAILDYIESHKQQKIFHFLRNSPSQLLSLDKILRDKAAREGKIFDLPILGSTKLLGGNLKRNLLEAVFTAENLSLAKPKSIGELEAFCTPFGQLFFYWMYHSLNLHLINPEMIPQVNKVKEIFSHTLGDPIARAQTLKEKLITSSTGVLFTQESDAFVTQALLKDGLFLPVDRQNGQDGTVVLLRSDLWKPDYKVIPIEGYDGYTAGRMNVILATQKGTSQQFLLASCHGHSTKAEDGRLQIKLIMDKFHQITDGTLQLFIGIDANTKTEEDVKLFKEHLELLGLTCTETGPTTVKKRMVTAQHSKAGRIAIDEEDYLITLKPEQGGQFQFCHVTVGFKEERADITQPLPNINNPSDHYPVGAVMVPFD